MEAHYKYKIPAVQGLTTESSMFISTYIFYGSATLLCLVILISEVLVNTCAVILSFCL